MFDVTIATHAAMPAGSSDDRLERAGVAIVPTVRATREGPVDLRILCAERGWQDVVVKPSVGASAKGAARFAGGAIADAGQAHLVALLARGDALVQPFQPAVQDARERSLVCIAGVFAHAFTKPPFLRGIGDGLGETLHEPTEAERHLAGQALRAVPGATTYARVDLVPTPDGPRLMELELIEPDLGLRLYPPSIAALVAAILGLSPTEALAAAGVPGGRCGNVRVISITGTNAGPMTGRGTNAYLLPGARPTLIDAPEATDAFVDRVADVLETEQPGATLAQVLITHFHHDHVDGVEALAKRWPDVTIAKLPFPEQDAAHAVTWTPLKDGQLVAAGDGTLWTLHTPGHAPDHLAFLEMRSSILFCGDLLVNGGTVAINPSAGGDLALYFTSLRRLLEDQPRRIYPGHGPPVDNPGALIRAYITHRLGRETQILDELAKAGGTEEELTSRVYPEVGPELRETARENLRAHLLKLAAEGRARESAGTWQAGG